MEIKKTPQTIQEEYELGRQYNSNIDLYQTVEKNRRFYIGDQWNGVDSGKLDKPIFNITKRVCGYLKAMLISDDFSVLLSPFDDSQESIAKMIGNEIEKAFERNNMRSKIRTVINDGMVDGDTFMYHWFDANYDTHQPVKGRIVSENVDNTRIIFGNPYDKEVQSQPFIIISQRKYVESVKDEARKNGIAETEVSKIQADSDSTSYEEKDSDSLCTALIKFWKENETVHYIKTCGQAVIKNETDLKYKLYPISHFIWEEKKNCYHGQSPITGLIPNQVFINKTFAMAMLYIKNNAFPRLLYDTNKIKDLTAMAGDRQSGLGLANLDILGKVMEGIKVPDFSNQVLQFIDTTINYTKEMMGASDAALGNIKPDNTSAIIAVQQSTAVPLENQRLAYYDFLEECVRIYIDIMASDYGNRQCQVDTSTLYSREEIQALQANGEEIPNRIIQTIDFSILNGMNYELNVDIGASSFWSETIQTTQLDNLFNKGIIADPIAYLESIPDKQLKNKAKLIESAKETSNQQQQLEMLSQENEQLKELLNQAGIQI